MLAARHCVLVLQPPEVSWKRSAGAVGPRVALCGLQGVPGQHEEPWGVLPGDAGHGDEERGLLRSARPQLHVRSPDTQHVKSKHMEGSCGTLQVRLCLEVRTTVAESDSTDDGLWLQECRVHGAKV